MPVYLLADKIAFPPADEADDDIVAIGGDLSVERLLEAYRHGIFPWYSAGEPILWWCPDPRFVLLPAELHISKSMRRVLNSSRFSFTLDTAFPSVIDHCAKIFRKGEKGTWITSDMKKAYCRLHEAGYAHSLEVWKGEELVGGVYGVSLGKCFFAESMFHTETNASKFALKKLVEVLSAKGFHFIDAQVYTEHVETLGAKDIPRKKFLQMLKEGLRHESWTGSWKDAVTAAAGAHE